MVSKVDKSQEENFDEQNMVEGEILESWPDKKESEKSETSEYSEEDQEDSSFKKKEEAEDSQDDSKDDEETDDPDDKIKYSRKSNEVERVAKKKNEKKKGSNAWQYFWYALILLIITAVLLVQFNASRNSKEKTIALVNGEKITQLDFDAEYGKLDNFTRITIPKEQIIEFLIKRKILLQEAKAQGILQENEQETLQKLLEKAIANIDISSEEVEDYYNANLEQFKISDSVRVQHILLCYNESISCNVNATEEQVKLNVGRLIRLLQKNASFESLALNYSNDPSVKENKGDLGYITRGQTVPEFEKLAFSLKAGDVSFTKTVYGYHVVKKLEEIKEGFIPLENIKDRIAEALILQKKQEAAKKYVEDLYNKSEIVRYDEKKE